MSNIDNRVVQMQFDNKQFESGIHTSVKSLDDLKNGLKLDESARSLSNLERVGRSFSLTGIAAGVENLANRFSTLGIIGMTALQNITNSAINAGKQFVSSLTIDPIKMGFQEYETKMNAIQTILTNTQGGQKKVTQQAIAATKETGSAAADAIRDANEESLKDLRKTQAQKLKEYQKLADDELNVVETKYEKESEALKKVISKEMTEYEKQSDKELEVVKDKYDRQAEALQESIDKENERVKKAHEERLDLYEEEYMSKLKVIDEEKYNKIKAIDAQIKSFKDLTKSENEERDKIEQQNRIVELQKRIDSATTAQDRIAAEKDLAEYKDKIYRQQVLKERESQIETLTSTKKTIEENYNLLKEQTKKEYDLKKEKENESYKIATEKLNEENSKKLNAIKDKYETEKKLLTESQKIIKEAIKEQQDERLNVLKTTYDKEKELITERQSEEKEALKEKQDNEIDALNRTHRAALRNIEDQKKAQIGSVNQVGELTKGSTLADVNRVLGELNEYSDKTIYNFAEMAKNIGTFTAAGIDLETAATSIKGIANLAAGSGSSSQQASTAMYQLSQALAAGSLKLQDWNSVVNAGMGGQLFQNALKATAKEMGIFVDESIPFRESLEKGWVTSDVLTKTLSKFAEDEALIKAATQVKTFTQLFDTMKESVQSGWAMSWENIIGDKDEATEMLTAINDSFGAMVGASADARNEMLAFWNANGGRAAIIEAITNAFVGLKSILKPIYEAFREVFPPMTGQQLVDISKKIRDLTENFKIGEQTADNIKRTFKGLFSVLDIGVKVLTFVADVFGTVLQALFPVTGGVLSITAVIGDFIVGLNNAIEQNKIFGTALKGIGVAVEFVKGIMTGTTEAISFGFETATTMLSEYITVVQTAIDKSITFFSEVIYGIKETFTELVASIGSVFNKTRDVTSKFSSIDLSGTTAFSDELSGAFDNLSASSSKVTDSFQWIGNALDKLKPIFVEAGNTIKTVFGPAVEFLLQKLKEMTLSDVGRLLAGGGFFMIAKALKDSIGSMKDVTKGFSEVLDGITGSLEAFQTKLKAEALLKISLAIGVLAASIIALSLINPDDLNRALVAISIIFTELSVAMMVLQKASLASPGIATKLIAVGTSILLLSFAMKTLSEVDKSQLSQGIEGLAALLTMLAIFNKVTSNVAGMQTGMTSIIGIALAVLILAEAVEKFGSIDPSKMEQGIKGISTSLVGLALFIKMVGTPERMISLGVGILAIGMAMNLFAGAVAIFGAIPTENLIKGLTGIAAALMAVALSTKLMPNDASMITMGIGLNLISVALYTMAGAVALFGNMSLETLSIGIGAIAAALMVMAVAANAMTGSLSGAASIMAMAVAINILVPAIVLLGNLELSTIGIALLALAGVFVVLGLSALILSPLAPVILTLAASVAVLGIGIYAVGAGLVLFSAGLAALAAGGAVFITALIKLLPEILELAKSIVQGLIKVFTDLMPPLVEAGLKFVLVLLQKLAEYVPPMIKAGMELLKGVLKGIADNIQEIYELAIDVMVGFLRGLTKKLPEIIEVGADLIVAFMEGIGNQYYKLIDAGFKLMIDFINGLADAIRENMPILNDALVNLITAMLDGLGDTVLSFVDIGKHIIGGLIDGIKAMAGGVVDAVKDVGSGAIGGLKTLLGIHSPSTVFAEIGMRMDEGMANGLKKFSGLVGSASENVGNKAINSFSGVMSNIADIVSGDLELVPTIRPVLDLSNVQAGNKEISSMFNGQTISANTRAIELAGSIVNNRSGQTTTIESLPKEPKEPNPIQNIFHIATLAVREEADVNKVARKLHQLQVAGSRG